MMKDCTTIRIARYALPCAVLLLAVNLRGTGMPCAAGSEEDVPEAGETETRGGLKVRFAYDVNFEMNFDNRENTSDLSPSMTVFGARLTPEIGIGVTQGNGTRHRVMLGVDIMKDFGRGPDASPDGLVPGNKGYANADLFKEMTMYYRMDRRMGKTDFSLTAGIFPKRFSMSREYSPAFISDSLKFYDNNYEGLLLSFSRPKSCYEVGCDWMGMYGTDRRERFMIFSSGEGRLSDMFSLGYAAYLYHFAGAAHVSGVVDNALVNPFVTLDLSRRSGLQRLDFTLGWLQSFQNDRKAGRLVFPHGGEFTASLRNWNVGIENYLFYGTDMMPFFSEKDSAGNRYGNLLYMGEAFYKVRLNTPGAGFYDRLEIYYEPAISDFMSIRASVTAHFNDWSYSGLQQVVTVRFNLGKLLEKNSPDRKPKKRTRIEDWGLPGWNI